MKSLKLLFMIAGLILASSSKSLAAANFTEQIYVESPTDTDADGQADRIFVSVSRPDVPTKVSTIYEISPYAMGGNWVAVHAVDSDILPQDEPLNRYSGGLASFNLKKTIRAFQNGDLKNNPRYAYVEAHSLGTGLSTGCPTVGDMSETLAAKSVIDWLNGRARAFYPDGREAKADWSNGKVGMTGVSYNGTLPIMVAATGVEGLKAIVPIAAIGNWYNYYRANGLVVNPGGYIGEDADVLGYFIAREGTCKSNLEQITKSMARENGDFTQFWQDRNYLTLAKNIKAATFIIHGQSDWNVKQANPIQLWEGLEGGPPRKMFLHRGGHGSTSSHGVPAKIQAWFDHFLEGDENGITSGPPVQVELLDASLMNQQSWPNENTKHEQFYFSNGNLSGAPAVRESLRIIDSGAIQNVQGMIGNSDLQDDKRLIFLSPAFSKSRLLSGTSRVSLNLALKNRKAANITVALIEYKANGKAVIITLGWADPQNYQSLSHGEILVPGQFYNLSFELEPKQYLLAPGSKLGVLITSTDYDFTLRPKPGTEIEFRFDEKSFIDLSLSSEL